MSISLNDFVRQTLIDITNGVHEAQKSAPHWIAPGHVEGAKQLSPQMIEFSVQVTASEKVEKRGDGELSIPLITIVKAGITGSIDSESNNTIVQNLKFSVPVYFQAPKTQTRDSQ